MYSYSFVFEAWTWTFSTIRSKAFLTVCFNPLTFHERFWTFLTFLRPEKLRNSHGRLRMVNGHETLYDQSFETFAKSPSRYLYIHDLSSNAKESLYNLYCCVSKLLNILKNPEILNLFLCLKFCVSKAMVNK